MITGQVLDTSSEPVQGARITTNGTTAGYSDSLGNYYLGIGSYAATGATANGTPACAATGGSCGRGVKGRRP